MRFLTDQNVYAATARLLIGLGQQVVLARDAGLARADDPILLEYARDNDLILITRDRDFGHLVVGGTVEAGVIYLRITPSTVESIHAELGRVLAAYPEERLARAFVVVEPGRHRIRPVHP
jgi:predicted nuclease of predicted toxin-antitoxin system